MSVEEKAGIRSYYLSKIDELQTQTQAKQHNLRRLEAQRNELNSRGPAHPSAPARSRAALPGTPLPPRVPPLLHSLNPPSAPPAAHNISGRRTKLSLSTLTPPSCVAVRLLREELQMLQEPGSYIGEVIKVMGKTKILVKVQAQCAHKTRRLTVALHPLDLLRSATQRASMWWTSPRISKWTTSRVT